MVVQSLLVVIALACVPCMLIVKTLILRRQYLWRKHLVRNKWYHLKLIHCISIVTLFKLFYFSHFLFQGTQNFGGIRVGNGPTEDEAEIIQHDQLSQHSEEEPEVKETYSHQ